MREILVNVEDLSNSRRVDVGEFIASDKAVTCVNRACIYSVLRQISIPNLNYCIQWAQSSLPPPAQREIFLIKDYDKGQSIEYRVVGCFYVVINLDIFEIGYDHKMKLNVMEF